MSSSISSNTQPVAAPIAATPIQPKDAEIKLFKTNVEQLWYETVLKAAWYEKPFALISYAWNRSTAVEKDTKFGATIELLNTKLTALVSAVAKRTLSSEEASKAGVAALQFSSEGAQKDSLERELAVNTAEKEFYDVFRKRCTELEITANHQDFGTFVTALKNKIAKVSNNENLVKESGVSKELISLKMNTLAKSLSVRVYDDLVAAAIPASIADLTADGFKKAIKLVQDFFPENDIETVEQHVRRLIVQKFGKDLDKRSEEFLVSGNAAKVTATKAELIKAHTEKEASIQAEINALRGPNGNDGTLNAAYVKLTEASNALTAADQAFRAKYLADLGVAVVNSVEDLINLPGLPASLNVVKANFIEAKEKRAVADKEFKKLNDSLAKCARFVGDEKRDLNARIAALRGPNGVNNGLINAAYEKTVPALATLNAADAAFRAAYVTAYGAIEAVPTETVIHKTTSLVPSMNQVKADYLAAKIAHDAVTKAQADLNAELVKLDADLVAIAPRQDAEIMGGTLIQEQNAKIDANATIEAQAQVKKTGQLFKEWSTLVKDDERKARSTALHAIIG